MALRIRRGDRVIVISGSYKGQIGTVVEMQNDRAKVDGINVLLRHVKKRGEEPGRIEKILGGIHVSNLSHVDTGDKAARVSFRIKDGVKYLVYRKDSSKEIRKV